PGDPGLRITPVGEPGRLAAFGVGRVDLGVAVPPAGPGDPGPVAGEPRVAHRYVVGGQPPGATARDGTEPDIVSGDEGDQVAVNVREAQVSGRHHAAPWDPRGLRGLRGFRGGSGGGALTGPGV